jgi:hypothetical protein
LKLFTELETSSHFSSKYGNSSIAKESLSSFKTLLLNKTVLQFIFVIDNCEEPYVFNAPEKISKIC